MKKELFGKTQCGKEVYLYTLENSKGMKATVMNYGAILVKLIVPDKDGNCADVVTGYDSLEKYFVNGAFFGSVIAPSANRIADAKFALNGVEYKLAKNNGENNLHSDAFVGSHKRVWCAEEGDNSVKFSIEMEDGDMGFPGNKKISVTYTLTEENELKLCYTGSSDKDTVFNMTNHAYFNLDGHGAGNILDHVLTLNAKYFTEIIPGAIPTGKLLPVEGTPMDFTSPKRIGDEIDADWEQLALTDGYDHNWCLDNYDGNVRLVAEVTNGSGSRTMQVYTDLPGVQFYAANSTEDPNGKGGAKYAPRCALCLETQFYPNAVNEPSFPSPVFGPGKDCVTTTIFKF